MIEEIRAFALLRNRREQQWRRLHGETTLVFPLFRGLPHRCLVHRKGKLIRQQRQDGVRR